MPTPKTVMVKCVWCGEEQKDLQALVLHRARKHHRIGVRAKWDEEGGLKMSGGEND